MEQDGAELVNIGNPDKMHRILWLSPQSPAYAITGCYPASVIARLNA